MNFITPVLCTRLADPPVLADPLVQPGRAVSRQGGGQRGERNAAAAQAPGAAATALEWQQPVATASGPGLPERSQTRVGSGGGSNGIRTRVLLSRINGEIARRDAVVTQNPAAIQ